MQAKPGPGLLVVVHRLAPIWFEGDDLFGRILPKSELFHIKLANFFVSIACFRSSELFSVVSDISVLSVFIVAIACRGRLLSWLILIQGI